MIADAYFCYLRSYISSKGCWTYYTGKASAFSPVIWPRDNHEGALYFHYFLGSTTLTLHRRPNVPSTSSLGIHIEFHSCSFSLAPATKQNPELLCLILNVVFNSSFGLYSEFSVCRSDFNPIIYHHIFADYNPVVCFGEVEGKTSCHFNTYISAFPTPRHGCYIALEFYTFDISSPTSNLTNIRIRLYIASFNSS